MTALDELLALERTGWRSTPVSRGATAPSFVARMSSAYVRVDDAWRLALYQQSLARPDGG